MQSLSTAVMPTKPHAKLRLDLLLVERGLFDSREKAQRAILAGEVAVGDRTADKPGTRFPADAEVRVQTKDRYVSRGGLKLEAALRHFALDPTGRVCLDIGASTGGFTDCLLQHGAAKVYAYDVGHSQLDWKIRRDPRVAVKEKINARHLTPDDFDEAISLCVIDVSFIGLTLILPPACRILASKDDGQTTPRTILALIKPQFELERRAVGSGGVVRDPDQHARAVEKVRAFAAGEFPDWRWTGVIDSPILGASGNKEFLACLQK